jgi:G3E family GTPase
VVDCFNFLQDFKGGDTLEKRSLAEYEGDARTVVDLLVDQIEFADVILLNKVDLVTDEQRLLVRNLIHRLNPDAKIIETRKSTVPVRNCRARLTASFAC